VVSIPSRAIDRWIDTVDMIDVEVGSTIRLVEDSKAGSKRRSRRDSGVSLNLLRYIAYT